MDGYETYSIFIAKQSLLRPFRQLFLTLKKALIYAN